ncbi:cellulose-binding protein [Streptomyces sp. ICBB 8177]|uniref:cellulose-binding protein n=1 Tax=Streptomyces sp. ICBB 8177 TaxID=563922 RepID=UPI000D68193E|nr:cellulose-binding protein [Streptomyces sp. ICBB 8177]PWI46037.1 cellulose-binding protein [Streptomyces sp. ICBB 8177]
MAQSVTPEEFSAARGRGYHPEQVEEYLAGLSAERDAAWERAARLTVLANDMDAEAAALRTALEALGTADYAALGEGAQRLLATVEEEAADVRARAEAAARAEYEAADRAARALRDQARAEMDERLAALDEAARRDREAAEQQAAEIRGAAQAEADQVRGEAERALDGVRQDVARTLAEQEKEQRERLDALEHELAEREAGVDSRLADLTAHAERLLADAEREYEAAREDGRRMQGEAESTASGLLLMARATEERLDRDTERELRAHEARRDEIRAHLANVRTSLAALTGRPGVPDPAEPPAEEA